MTATTQRTKLRRRPQQGAHDRDTIHRILDEAMVCHVGFVLDATVRVIPTLHARIDDDLYLHGSSAGGMMRSIAAGQEICVTVTLLDDLVLARAAFEQNVNYRAVMVFGAPTPVIDEEEKLAGLRALTNQLLPDRWEQCRPPTRQELKGTALVRLGLDEASAKVRAAGPTDADRDLELPYWAGVVPRTVTWGPPRPEPGLPDGVAIPAQLAAFDRQGS
jgi:nitroimidazol reductase NimA-like FMN-containing flavoprotein (pyridoxamine 5'-phosphate oxidase superfamily)